MCADGAKPVSQKYNYSNCFNGLYTVLRQEGLPSLYRGLLPNVVRSALMSKLLPNCLEAPILPDYITDVSQIATYQVSKTMLLKNIPGAKDGVPIHLGASILSGTVATTVCAPADVLKSRIQSASGNQGIMDVIRTSLKNEGPSFLFRGWVPAWLRLGCVTFRVLVIDRASCVARPNTVLMFLFMEQLQKGIEYVTS